MWGNAVGPLSLFAKLEIASRALTRSPSVCYGDHNSTAHAEPFSRDHNFDLCSAAGPHRHSSAATLEHHVALEMLTADRF